jgi:hypothetical protein
VDGPGSEAAPGNIHLSNAGSLGRPGTGLESGWGSQEAGLSVGGSVLLHRIWWII